jgi:hypothetical protein
MANATTSSRRAITSGATGSAALWCSKTRVQASRPLREAHSSLGEPRPTNLSSVICHLSFSCHVDR